MSQCPQNINLPFHDEIYDLDTTSLKALSQRLAQQAETTLDDRTSRKIKELIELVSLEIEERSLAIDFEANCEMILGNFDLYLKEVDQLITQNTLQKPSPSFDGGEAPVRVLDGNGYVQNKDRVKLPPIALLHAQGGGPATSSSRIQVESLSNGTHSVSQAHGQSTQLSEGGQMEIDRFHDAAHLHFDKKGRSRTKQRKQANWADYVKNTLMHTKMDAQVITVGQGMNKDKIKKSVPLSSTTEVDSVYSRNNKEPQGKITESGEKKFLQSRSETIKNYDKERRKMHQNIGLKNDGRNMVFDKDRLDSEHFKTEQIERSKSDDSGNSLKTDQIQSTNRNGHTAILRKGGSANFHSTDKKNTKSGRIKSDNNNIKQGKTSHNKLDEKVKDPLNNRETKVGGRKQVSENQKIYNNGQFMKMKSVNEVKNNAPCEMMRIEPELDEVILHFGIAPELLDERILVHPYFESRLIEYLFIFFSRPGQKKQDQDKKIDRSLSSKSKEISKMKERNYEKITNNDNKFISHIENRKKGDCIKGGDGVEMQMDEDNNPKKDRNNPKISSIKTIKKENALRKDVNPSQKNGNKHTPVPRPPISHQIKTKKISNKENEKISNKRKGIDTSLANVNLEQESKDEETQEQTGIQSINPHDPKESNQIEVGQELPNPTRKSTIKPVRAFKYQPSNSKNEKMERLKEEKGPNSLDGKEEVSLQTGEAHYSKPDFPNPVRVNPLELWRSPFQSQAKLLMSQTGDLRALIPEPLDYSDSIPTWTHLFSQLYHQKSEIDLPGVMRDIKSIYMRQTDIIQKIDSKLLDIAFSLSPLELGRHLMIRIA